MGYLCSLFNEGFSGTASPCILTSKPWVENVRMGQQKQLGNLQLSHASLFKHPNRGTNISYPNQTGESFTNHRLKRDNLGGGDGDSCRVKGIKILISILHGDAYRSFPLTLPFSWLAGKHQQFFSIGILGTYPNAFMDSIRWMFQPILCFR